MSSPQPALTSCTSISFPISQKVRVSDLLAYCSRRSPFSPWILCPPSGLPSVLGTDVWISSFPRYVVGSVSDTNLTPAFFQNLPTLEHRHDRSSHVSSFKNSRPMCMMNCYGGRIIRRRTKVRQSAPLFQAHQATHHSPFDTLSPFFARLR